MQHKVSMLHPYIDERQEEISAGLYPKHHLWATQAISEYFSCESSVRPRSILSSYVERFINRFLFGHYSPGLAYEIPALITSHSNDLIYSVCGPLSLTRLYQHSKLVSWVFRPPTRIPVSPLAPYHPLNLGSHNGFLCLTPKAQKYFSQFAPARFVPWCVDLELFNGRPPQEKPTKPFFLATGKTFRDYETFVKGCYDVDAEIRIIGPATEKPRTLPANVCWINTSSDPPDQAIGYPTLREWYAQCTAVCIPLSGDADDTCGYTNMLEAMAMGKPVLMTRSGCLHIDPESGNFGRLISPKDSNGWKESMNELLHNDAKVQEYGMKGRMVAERDFTIERFDREVIQFLKDILST